MGCTVKNGMTQKKYATNRIPLDEPLQPIVHRLKLRLPKQRKRLHSEEDSSLLCSFTTSDPKCQDRQTQTSSECQDGPQVWPVKVTHSE